jgi:hypothetical protein
MKPDRELAQFSRLVEAVRPWLGQIIFVGGWAHRLYRVRPEAAALLYEPLRTDDADLALDPRAFGKSENIRARLIDRGFAEDMSGDDQPTRLTAGPESGQLSCSEVAHPRSAAAP